MDSNSQFLDGAGYFWDPDCNASPLDAANVDPLLHYMPSSSAPMNNTPFNHGAIPSHELGAFDPNLPLMNRDAMVPVGELASRHRTSTSSSSRTTSIQSEIVVSPTASRTSSNPSMNSSMPRKIENTSVSTQKPPRHRPLRQRETRPSYEEPPPQTRPIVQEANIAEQESSEDEGSKRTDFLKRNRLAASRCRQKKKQWVHHLEETKLELEQQNMNLQMQRRSLIDELSTMKHHIMSHAGCNDANIDMWIDMEAKKVVEKSLRRSNTATSSTSFHGGDKL